MLIKKIRRYLPPLNNAFHGDANNLVCGGKTPGIEVWCSIVEIRLDCTETRLPPMPFIIGWKTTYPVNESTALSSTRPPNLHIINIYIRIGHCIDNNNNVPADK